MIHELLTLRLDLDYVVRLAQPTLILRVMIHDLLVFILFYYHYIIIIFYFGG